MQSFEMRYTKPVVEAGERVELNKKTIIKDIIRRQAVRDQSTRILASIENLSDDEITQTLNHAARYITKHHQIDQFHLGGDFVSPDGRPNRGRRIISLDEPELMQRYPFLRFLCLKIVPQATTFEKELDTHWNIQKKLAQQPDNTLKIPLLLQKIDMPDLGMRTAIMERLPRDARNGSLQTLIARAQEENVSLRLANNVEGDIVRAFQAFHCLGFEHRDINDGNIYLTSIRSEEVEPARSPGKNRPRKLRLITGADIYLLDFERTHPLPASQPDTSQRLIDLENINVQSMIDPYVLNIDTTSDPEDLAEALDDHAARYPHRPSLAGISPRTSRS